MLSLTNVVTYTGTDISAEMSVVQENFKGCYKCTRAASTALKMLEVRQFDLLEED